MENKEQPRLIFLPDEPSSQDELGSHKRIAELLKRVLDSTRGHKPTVLGLYGDWGTGKSTIINLYDKLVWKEYSGESINVIVDTWANSRQRFMQTFLSLAANELLSPGEAKALCGKIDSRNETTIKVQQLPVLGHLAFLIVIFVALIVIFKGSQHASALVAILLSGVLHWYSPYILSQKETILKNLSFNESDHFRGIFQEIIKETKFTKISFVVDNLDRVDHDEVVEVLSAIRTLASSDASLELRKGREFLKLVGSIRKNWPLVRPILRWRRQLSRFIKGKGSGHKGILFILPADIAQLANRKTSTSKDQWGMLNKTIQLSIHVPQLVHQNIIGFTTSKLEVVASTFNSQIDKNDLEGVGFILAKAARKSPREVKNLINSFSLVWNGLGSEHPVAPIAAALFVGYRYLAGSQEIPTSVPRSYSSEESNETRDYREKVGEYFNDVLDSNWRYLCWQQRSKGEEQHEDFIEIYDLMTENDHETIANKHVENRNLPLLLNDLGKFANEAGGLPERRFASFSLYLVAENKLTASKLPVIAKNAIKRVLKGNDEQAAEIIGPGLVEFLVEIKSASLLESSLRTISALQSSEKFSKPFAVFYNALIGKYDQLEISRPQIAEDRISELSDRLLSSHVQLAKSLATFRTDGPGLALAKRLKLVLDTAEIEAEIPVVSDEKASLAFAREMLTTPKAPTVFENSEYWIDLLNTSTNILFVSGHPSSYVSDEWLQQTYPEILKFVRDSAAAGMYKRSIIGLDTLLLLRKITRNWEFIEKPIEKETNKAFNHFATILEEKHALEGGPHKSDRELFMQRISAETWKAGLIVSSAAVRLSKFKEIDILHLIPFTGKRLPNLVRDTLKEASWVNLIQKWLRKEKAKRKRTILAEFLKQASLRQFVELPKAFRGLRASNETRALVNQKFRDLVPSVDLKTDGATLVALIPRLNQFSKLDDDVLSLLESSLGKHPDPAVSINLSAEFRKIRSQL